MVVKKEKNIKNNTQKKEKTEPIDETQKSGNIFIKLIVTSSIIIASILLVILFPRITLEGSEEITISYNEIYEEPGYNGYIFKKDITNNIDVVNNINNNVIGDYEINYFLDLFGARVKKTRNIKIIDNISPTIKIDSDIIKVCPNEVKLNYQYEAIDEYDGDITSKVEEIVSDNEILLTVKDSSYNVASTIIKIDRVDNEKPQINLKGNTIMYISYGSNFTEPGYTANDNCNGDITDKVEISGTVGRNIGTYLLTYSVSDESGNKTSVERKVIIGANYVDNGNIYNGAIYLTFDDGPNQGTTNQILDILKEEGIKATFFITCKGPDSLIKRIHDEGHTIALHTATHEYSYIYSSIENYFNDLNQVSNRVKNITGIESKIIRFPGGSSNTVSRNYKKGIMTELSNILLNDGYRYYDWNVDGMDASSARNSQDVYYNVTANLSPYRSNVVLLHDTKSITVGALRDIIKFGKQYGYSFNKIEMNTYMVRHQINN